MNDVLRINDERTTLIRLTALWALNEAGLGGLMHLFRSPFTGIFVGGGAVLLISLIGYTAKKPAPAILKALVLVLIIKGIVSPHSPLPAYLAVSFQGLVGAILFTVLPSFRVAALLLGGLALLEAAVQKLLVMTLLFGMPLWESIDAFVDGVLKKMGVLDSGSSASGSLWVVGLYVGVYLVSGLFIGWMAGRLPQAVGKAASRLTVPEIKDPVALHGPRQPKPFYRNRLFKIMLLLIGVLLSEYYFSPQTWQTLLPLWLFLRVLLVLGVWYFLVGPLLMRLLQRFLKKKQSAYQQEVDAALDLLPVFRSLSRSAWAETKHLSGWRRLREVAVRIVAYALLFSKKTG